MVDCSTCIVSLSSSSARYSSNGILQDILTSSLATVGSCSVGGAKLKVPAALPGAYIVSFVMRGSRKELVPRAVDECDKFCVVTRK